MTLKTSKLQSRPRPAFFRFIIFIYIVYFYFLCYYKYMDMEGNTTLPQSPASAPPQPASGRKWTKIVVPILIIVAIGLIATIIYLALARPSSTTSSASNIVASDSDFTGDNPQQIEYRRLNYLIENLNNRTDIDGSREDEELENGIKTFVSEAVRIYGVDTPQEAEARILLSDYYFTIGRNDLGVNYLNNSISTTNSNTSKIYYYLALYDHYLSIDDVENQIETLEEALDIPTEDIALYDDDWATLRVEYEEILDSLRNESPNTTNGEEAEVETEGENEDEN